MLDYYFAAEWLAFPKLSFWLQEVRMAMMSDDWGKTHDQCLYFLSGFDHSLPRADLHDL